MFLLRKLLKAKKLNHFPPKQLGLTTEVSIIYTALNDYHSVSTNAPKNLSLQTK